MPPEPKRRGAYGGEEGGEGEASDERHGHRLAIVDRRERPLALEDFGELLATAHEERRELHETDDHKNRWQAVAIGEWSSRHLSRQEQGKDDDVDHDVHGHFLRSPDLIRPGVPPTLRPARACHISPAG
jgi:hypothetical protein